jgi:GAF domain-containing protein
VDGFAEEFARLAVELHEQSGVPETVDIVLAYALRAVAAGSASVMLLHDGKTIEVAGVTDQTAARADELQLECGEGPCLDSAVEADSFEIADTLHDMRWPTWGKRVARELGIRSVLSVRLTTPSSQIGALNLYDDQPDRFDRDDDAVAHVLARHASVALAATRNQTNLWRAIDARKLIGQAQGILMERFDLDADQAFAVLRRYSQDNNIKLREVAQRLIDTRRLPGP